MGMILAASGGSSSPVFEPTITLGNLLATATLLLTIVLLAKILGTNLERFGAVMNAKFDGQMQTVNEKLDNHLRVLVVTDGKAKESLQRVADALREIDQIDGRLRGIEHRLGVVERYQVTISDQAHEIRRAQSVDTRTRPISEQVAADARRDAEQEATEPPPE